MAGMIFSLPPPLMSAFIQTNQQHFKAPHFPSIQNTSSLLLRRHWDKSDPLHFLALLHLLLLGICFQTKYQDSLAWVIFRKA